MNEVYILFIPVPRNMKILVGNLGKITCKRGTYLYIGRARTNLSARIARHYRKEKKLFWHIDYLLSWKGVEIKKVWAGKCLTECELARKISFLSLTTRFHRFSPDS